MQTTIQDLPLYLAQDNTSRDSNEGLIKGGIYAIKLGSAPSRLLLLRNALTANLSRGVHCTVITPLSIEALISTCNKSTSDFFLKAISDGRLYLYAPMGDYKTNMFRYGQKRFLQELEQFCVPNKSFIVFDQAELLFSGDDRDLIAAQACDFLKWMQQTQNIALFLFPNTTELEPEGLYFQALAKHFSGIAGLYIFRNRLEFGVDFWTTQSGLLMAQPLPVNICQEGLIDIKLSLAANRRAERRPRDAQEANPAPSLVVRPRLKMSEPAPHANVDAKESPHRIDTAPAHEAEWTGSDANGGRTVDSAAQ